MDRVKAYLVLTSMIKNQNLIRHHLAAEAAMRGIAEYLRARTNADISIGRWGIVGLLHDADYEMSKNDPEKHTVILEEKIGKELEPDILYAIKAHAYKYNANGVEPKSLMDWSMYTCDELTGFIVASALIHPDKKLVSIDVDFILNRMKESSFAKAVDRNQIKLCEEKLGIPLNDFIKIVLESMQKIAVNLGL